MISINFSSKSYRLITRIQNGLTIGAVLLAIASVLIIRVGAGLRTESALLDRKVKELKAAEEALSPLLAERDRVMQDLISMSGLMETRRFSWTRLLTDIENSFPVGVAVDHIDLNPRDRVLTLDGLAHSPESLRNLIVGLEKSARFKDPYLKHQSIDKGSISFNVVAHYSENKSAGVAQGK